MKIRLGSIPSSSDFDPIAPWRSLREPSPWLMQCMAIPLGLLTFAIFFYLWSWLGYDDYRQIVDRSGPWLLFSILVTVVIHEILHAIIHPSFGFSQYTWIGFWPSKLLFYAHYEEEMSRNRFLAVFASPFLFLSVLPLAWTWCGLPSSMWLAFISSFNALSACGDMVGMIIVLSQIPAQAVVRNQGWRSYWRFVES